MRILLISPPLNNMDVFQVRVRGCMPPLDLMYLASSLEAAGHEAKILDLYAGRLADGEIIKEVENYSPAVVGLTTYTANLDQSLEISRLIKKNFPEVKIVLGGIHASYLSQVCLAEPAVDFVVRGEGERTICELADALQNGKNLSGVNGLAMRENGAVVFTPPRKLEEDLDSLPPPAHHLVDFAKYHLSVTRAVTAAKAASVLTMRGCRYACTFCSHHYGYGFRVRKRSPEKVVDEIAHLCEKYGIKEFQFEDSSFTCDAQRAMEICSLIKKRGLKIVWNCNIRADTASDELFSAMSSAGCLRALLGVESGSQRMLNAMKKAITVEAARKAVRLAEKHGMRVNCAFVIGTPGETRDSAEETFRLALELDPDYAMFSVFMPSIGSELFDKAVSEGKVDPARARGADYITVYAEREPVVEMCGIPRAELLELMEKFTRGFYLRPRYIIKRILGLSSPAEIAKLFWGIALIFSHQINLVKSFFGKKND